VAEAELETTSHGGDDVAREIHALGAQIAALQAEVRRIQGTALPLDAGAGWDDEPPASYAWVGSLDASRRTGVRIPRLPFELAFLAAAAVLAGAAHLKPTAIAAVMGVAWVIVALAEWAGSYGDRMRNRILLSAPLPAPAAEGPVADPAWFSPPVEHTMLSHARRGAGATPETSQESDTIVSRLPRPADPTADPETTAVPPSDSARS
jgi:hypothetical protein